MNCNIVLTRIDPFRLKFRKCARQRTKQLLGTWIFLDIQNNLNRRANRDLKNVYPINFCFIKYLCEWFNYLNRAPEV